MAVSPAERPWIIAWSDLACRNGKQKRLAELLALTSNITIESAHGQASSCLQGSPDLTTCHCAGQASGQSRW